VGGRRRPAPSPIRDSVSFALFVGPPLISSSNFSPARIRLSLKGFCLYAFLYGSAKSCLVY
jgi:hypothetical protein